MKLTAVVVYIVFFALPCLANPYPDPRQIPLDDPSLNGTSALKAVPLEDAKGSKVLRINIGFEKDPGHYVFSSAVEEFSGTPSLNKRTQRADELGSFRGELADAKTGQVISFDSHATGQEFRLLSRGVTFRFPFPAAPVVFRFYAENPVTGIIEKVLEKPISVADIVTEPELPVEARVIKPVADDSKIILVVYAEGYGAAQKEKFFNDALKVVAALNAEDFPMLERIEVRAAFAPSAEKLGTARELGLPVPERDSFLGLYYPYWDNFGRWYNVVYPTREERFKRALGQVAYDYPVVLIDSADYWGVGNYMEFTAIPANHPSFTYLLTHEFGHFFGLNEEYNEGGKTELAFAPGIHEPWSQNITFFRDPSQVKWAEFVRPGTPIPTPLGDWHEGNYGVYPGGYAETEPLDVSHKPGLRCVMDRYQHFCPVCRRAIEDRLRFSLGSR